MINKTKDRFVLGLGLSMFGDYNIMLLVINNIVQIFDIDGIRYLEMGYIII